MTIENAELDEVDPIGTVYLTPRGDVYRLKWVNRDRRSGETRPEYAVISADGLHGDSHSLPGGSITIYEPERREAGQPNREVRSHGTVTDAEVVEIANRAQEATGISIWPRTVRAVLEADREARS